MEVILFASLYRTIEVLIFCVHFFCWRTFYPRGATEVEFPFFHMKKASGGENWEVPADFFSSPVVGLHSVGRFISGRFCRVCLGTGEFLRPQGAIPPGLYPLRGGLGLLPRAPEAPPKRGMPTGPKVFLALPDACGLRPGDRAHLKNGLVPYSCVGGTQR